ncbi:hypothetical protein POM88_042283 [Heracleum sosnowskyi]|uniref:DUF7787 domain-containing protein n=1 Tax=Heracleum sosnowskyi TaxID=360622 RepID=A0AAD8MBH3_9APIA|nr:hypothetical protein POM88_042283 [Heracleum sosnowskyi]
MEMELQCCGEFEAGSRKYKSKPLTIQKYLDFCVNHKHSDLTADHLRKIISIHGLKSLHKVKKEVLIDAVDSIKLMDLTRSTINDDNVSSYAFINSQEAIKDLICLNWIECSVTSFKTLNYDLISLQSVSTFGLKSLSTKKKRTKMIRSKEGIQPVCSLTSGDQCSVAKGNTADCAAADYLSSSSLLLEEGEERPRHKRQASGRLEEKSVGFCGISIPELNLIQTG